MSTQAALPADIQTLVTDTLKMARDAFAELAQVQSRADELEKEAVKSRIQLEKVANTPVFDKAAVARAADALILTSFLPRENKEAFIQKVSSDPGSLLTLLPHIAELSAGYDSGRGVPKSASSTGSSDTDPDGWHRLRTEGA